jgi:hypothetical protein
MDDFQKQLVLLVLDKGLLALLLGGLGVLAKRYLDRQAAQRVYDQKIAEERIRAYKEVNRIVAEQLMMMARVLQLFDEPGDTETAKAKTADSFLQLYNRLRESYMTDVPKIQADVIFFSSEVGSILIKYINAFGTFMKAPHAVGKGEIWHPPPQGLLALSAQLSHALATEIGSFRA